jgi:hypothetical protein
VAAKLCINKSCSPIKIPKEAWPQINFFQPLRLQVIGTGKGGIWREKPPDAESAVWGQNP